MTEEIVITNPSEKTLKFLEIVKEKKYADQKRLAEMTDFMFSIKI